MATIAVIGKTDETPGADVVLKVQVKIQLNSTMKVSAIKTIHLGAGLANTVLMKPYLDNRSQNFCPII